MRLKELFVGEPQHLVIDPCGVTDAQHTDAAVHKLLTDPVYRHVALRTDHDLCLAP